MIRNIIRSILKKAPLKRSFKRHTLLPRGLKDNLYVTFAKDVFFFNKTLRERNGNDSQIDGTPGCGTHDQYAKEKGGY